MAEDQQLLTDKELVEMGDKVLCDLLSNEKNHSDEPATEFALMYAISKDDILSRRTPLMREFLKNLGEKYCTEKGHILDIGCGCGNDSALMVSYGHQVVSCDRSQGMLDLLQVTKDCLQKSGMEKCRDWEMMQADVRNVGEVIESKPHLPQKYNIVICLGTITYLLDIKDTVKAIQEMYSLLLPGGALMLDMRNFVPIVEKGIVNLKGRHVLSEEKIIGIHDAKSYVVFSPGPERSPIAAVLQFYRHDGGSTFITQRPHYPEQLTAIIRSVAGEKCSIKVLYDLQEETESSRMDACIVTYIVEKPLE